LMGSRCPYGKGSILMGKRAAHRKVSGRCAVSYAKTAEPIEMPFGMWIRMGLRNRVLDGDPNRPGHARRQSAVSCAKMAEPIEMRLGFMTRVGPTKRVLGGVVHWRQLLNTIAPSMYCGGDAACCQVTLITCLHGAPDGGRLMLVCMRCVI